DILYWLDRKILHFLVDEFQDTSDIQWAVLRKLTEEIFAGLGADKPMPSTLFVVGDAKQSIYRFREANYRLIENVRTKMEESLLPGTREIRTLDKNYRSVPEVIGAVNQVFSALWGEAYKRSATDRNRHQGSVQLIEVFLGEQTGTEIGLSEAGVLALEIRTLVDNGTLVHEKTSPQNPPPSPFSKGGGKEIPPLTKGGTGGLDDDWKTRPVQYGDCAILIQSRTRLKEYEAALKQEGVPFRVVGGIGFYEEDEIQAILNTLFFLWNRDDRLALAAALRSPLFGLPDQAIVDVFSGNKDALPVLRERQPQAWSRFNDWSKYAGTEPLAGLIHRIIQDSGAYIRFGKQNPQAIFNLDKLLDTARDFDRRGYTTLQDFVEWVRNIREAEQREATADMNLPGFQGAVSIMTVHKAKGLEFAVVFLPGLNQQPRSLTAGPLAIVESDDRVRMALKDADSPVYDELWEREKEELKREHQRLLYVAMTRARDHLFMIGTPNDSSKPAKDNTWLSYLYGALAVPSQRAENSGPAVVKRSYPDWAAQTHMPEQYGVGKRSPEQSSPTVAVDSAAVLANLRHLDVVDTPEWKKAIDYINDEKEWDMDQPLVQAGRSVSPRLRGIILHRCLEEYAKKGSYDLEAVLGEYPEMQTLDHDVRERFLTDVGLVMKSITGNAGLGWIFEPSPDAYAELPFLLRKGNDLVSGVIDRVIVKDGKGFVIDYKAIMIEDQDAAASWKEHYLPQVRIYCEAVKEIFRLKQVEGYLLFLDSSRLEPVVKV
ncbi:MAG TPA: hypothetical protein DCS42_03945, partial [Nitrospiraceae bacterium]|nr:hypothetical protein [Nitrospiraceae bacterium]